MSYQVGVACYATQADAGAAACAQYAPESKLVQDGAVVRTVSCTSADASTGALNLHISSTPVDGSSPSSEAVVQQQITFPPCQQFEYLEAAKVVFGAVLSLWAVIYGGKKLIEVINWGRGDLM